MIRATGRKLQYRKDLAYLAQLFWCLVATLGLALAASGASWAAAGSGVSVQALVEKDSVSVGEPLVLQIRIQGSDIAPGTEPPDMSGLADVTVEYLGGQSNNSSSITIVNGKMSKIESYGYVYSYRLTPKKTGRLEIPSITVPLGSGGSQALRTQPITIAVTAPEATDDFQLELKFSKTSFYLGEPVILTVVWYIGKDVESANFNLPILQDAGFTFTDLKMDQDPNKQYLQLQIGGANVLAEKGTGIRDGRSYTTLSFRKVIFARQPGTIEIPEASVSCRALVGYSRQQRGRSPFDGSFGDDLFNPAGRGVYKTFVARSQPIVLTVQALPETGKPANFSGLVGHFTVAASTSSTEASVGEPITLAVSISGPEVLDHVDLPPLAKDPEFEKDFKIPEEMAAGIIKGKAKQFIQTLRAKTPEVKAIPPVKLPCFNPDTGRYEVAQSQPIALVVHPTKVLTSADVEGKPGDAAVKKTELEDWSQGIAYNYEGPELLERQAYLISSMVRSPLWLAITLLPLLAFAALLTFTHIRQRNLADPGRMRSRKAFGRFEQSLQAVSKDGSRPYTCGVILDAIRGYLGDKLSSNASALTFPEVEPTLKDRGVGSELAERLKHLFEACELGSYGGMDSGKPVEDMAREASEVVRKLERVL
jgi:hypothetical protein